MPPGRGSAAGRKFLALPYYNQRVVFASLSAFLFQQLQSFTIICNTWSLPQCNEIWRLNQPWGKEFSDCLVVNAADYHSVNVCSSTVLLASTWANGFLRKVIRSTLLPCTGRVGVDERTYGSTHVSLWPPVIAPSQWSPRESELFSAVHQSRRCSHCPCSSGSWGLCCLPVNATYCVRRDHIFWSVLIFVRVLAVISLMPP